MNFKGACLRCGHKCSVAIIYCVSCLEFLEANVPMAQCGFAHSDGRHCRRDGRWHNGFCDVHQPPIAMFLLRQIGRWTKDTSTIHIVDDKGCLDSWISVLCKAGNERGGFVALNSRFWRGNISEATCPACIKIANKKSMEDNEK